MIIKKQKRELLLDCRIDVAEEFVDRKGDFRGHFLEEFLGYASFYD